MSETSQQTAAPANTAVAKPETAAVNKPNYQMGLFETDRFVTAPKVARAFGIAPVYAKDGVTVIGFANKHLKRKEIAEAHAGDLKGAARRDKVDQVIRESELELAAKITALLVVHKGKIGAKSFRVKRDDEGIEHYSIMMRQIPDTASSDLQRLMDAYGCKTPQELVDRLTKGNGGAAVEVETTVTQSGVPATTAAAAKK